MDATKTESLGRAEPDSNETSDSARARREGFVESVDGTRIFYSIEGAGPVVVLCDGILCEGFVWKYLRPLLLQHFRVLHWNYRAHGRSGLPRDRSRLGPTAHVDDLEALLDALGIARAALLGHSMGVQVCLEAYRKLGERITALVLICGSYGRITRTFQGSDALNRLLPTLLELRSRFPRVAGALWSSAPPKWIFWSAKLTGQVDRHRTRADDMIPYFEHLGEMNPEIALNMVKAAGEHTAEDVLSAVRAPTLVVAAERDSFTPPRLAEQMARQIPDAKYLYVVEGTHACPIEQPERVNAAIDEFLRERLRPTASE